jgi:hypothetical protein
MRHARSLRTTFALLLLLAACTTIQPPEVGGGEPSLDITTLALEASTIDFEGLAEGMIVDSVSHGAGISGFDATGLVTVFGFNPDHATNAAMIFDATCTPGGTPADCSGGDADLFKPGQGNVLIISEDLDGSDPDDADNGNEYFDFDFSGWGSGVVTIGTMVLDILDIEFNQGELPAQIELYTGGLGGVLRQVIPLEDVGNNGLKTIEIAANVVGVDFMRVTIGGSGAIDNIRIATDIPDDGEGCTPGYWRNHSEYAKGNQQDSWLGTGYDADDSFDTVFGVSSSDDDTLYEAVTSKGGHEQALQRHAVAALLNAASSVDFVYSEADVIALVQEAYAGEQFEGIKNLFAFQNELGCPLN